MENLLPGVLNDETLAALVLGPLPRPIGEGRRHVAHSGGGDRFAGVTVGAVAAA